jgi:hypothetical protein
MKISATKIRLLAPSGMRLVLALVLLAASWAAAAAGADTLPARVQVSWAPTEKLSEVKDNQLGRGWLRPEEWMKQLSEQLRRSADRLLPPGQQLRVQVNDIRLAGAFEPWRRPGLDDVRILKDIYPPYMDLHYTLLAADGSTIREGDAKLRDSSYLQRAVANTTDPLRYDKRMINEWLRKEFGPPRA